MANTTDLTTDYLRRYLNDETAVNTTGPTVAANEGIDPTVNANDLNYLRRYLNDKTN